MGAASRQHLSPSSKAMNPLASIAALFTLSFIEMWCAIAYCVQLDDVNKDCEDKWAFAVVLGLFSALVCVGFGLMIKFKPAMANGMVGMIMAGLLFAWWVAGVAVSTFDLPFAPGSSENTSGTYANIAGNGYFAVWGAVIASGSLLVSLIPAAQAAAAQGAGAGMNEKFIFMVAFASVIELWHSAKLCDDLSSPRTCENMLGWAIAVGATSTLITIVWLLVMKFAPSLAVHTKFVAAGLAVWWLAAIVTLTMPNGNTTSDCGNDNPYCYGVFLTVMNGFVGCWMALVGSILLVASSWGYLDEQAAEGGETPSTGGGHSTHTHTTTTTTTKTTTKE